MRTHQSTKALALLLVAVGLGTASLHAQVSIPPTYVLPSSVGDTNSPGFIWRISEVNAPEPNALSFAEAQLAGFEGVNLADPTAFGIALAAAAPPTPDTAPISFEIATVINLDKAAGSHGTFTPDDQMPGLPGGGPNGTDNAAAEALTYLDLPAGTITMGVNSDDGFRVTIGGANPEDRFAVNVGQFDGGRGAADTIFMFKIATPGIYAARLLWENGGGDANVEWFTVNGTNKVLVGDTADGGIKAFRALTVKGSAYASLVEPLPGQINVAPNAAIQVQLVDGGNPVGTSTVKLLLDGTQVNASITKTGGTTSISYTNATLFASGSTHNIALKFTDGTTPVEDDWSFTVASYTVLTPDAKVTPDTTKPGFIWSIFANSGDTANSNAKSEAALAGLLTDATGVAWPNLADPQAVGVATGPGTTLGSTVNATVSFVLTNVVNMSKVGGTTIGNFTPDDQMPGMPATDGSTDGSVGELVTYIELPAGATLMGVNSDDGFRTYAGYNPAAGNNPLDAFSRVTLGEFDGGRGSADTIFAVVVQEAGVYPFRTIWENGGGDANIEWFTVKSDGTKVLVNDVAKGGVKAYRAIVGAANPYVKFVTPDPAPRQVNQPSPVLSLGVQDGNHPVDDNSITITVDGSPVTVTKVRQGNVVRATFTPTVLELPGEQHSATLTFKDSTGAYTRTQNWTFYNLKNIILPTPVLTENFDEYANGEIFTNGPSKTNWYAFNYSDSCTAGFDLTDATSDAYKGWIVITADQMTTFESDTANIRPGELLNGQPITSLFSGNVLFAESDNRCGSQVQFIISKSFDLSSVTNPVLSFSSLYKQNQDSEGTVEYSVDGGTNWLPVIYFLDTPDIVVKPDGSVDAVATMENPNLDTASWKDSLGQSKGGKYGDALGAPITQALAPYIVPRINDDKTEGKRMEVIRLPQASKQSDVRLRFSQLGTCSWYFGIDNIAFYDVAGGPTVPLTGPTLSAALSAKNLTLSWPASATGFTLESAVSLTNPSWAPVGGVANNSVVVQVGAGNQFYRLRK
ncbi:MAG: hypothetical protein ACYDH9_07945 [Limisphaerales bacterium]